MLVLLRLRYGAVTEVLLMFHLCSRRLYMNFYGYAFKLIYLYANFLLVTGAFLILNVSCTFKTFCLLVHDCTARTQDLPGCVARYCIGKYK